MDHIPRGQRTEARIRAMFDAGIWKGRVQAVYVKRRVEDEDQHASNVRRVETATKSATSTHTKRCISRVCRGMISRQSTIHGVTYLNLRKEKHQTLMMRKGSRISFTFASVYRLYVI